jgi:hypothetical protein
LTYKEAEAGGIILPKVMERLRPHETDMDKQKWTDREQERIGNTVRGIARKIGRH